MPLLGAIGNASQYSFRGTYDNYPFDIDFGDISNAEPRGPYYSKFFPIEDINYKVPISITGDGEYYIGNINYINTFDNTSVKFNTQSVTFDSKFPEIDYTTQPSYVRNGNTVGLRIYGIPPIKITGTLNVELQSSSLIEIPLDESINIELRDGLYSFNPNNSIDVNQRTAIGREYYGKTYSTTVTIGKKSFEWTVTTKSGSGPFNFKFDDYIDSPLSTEVTSNSYTVSGLSDGISYEVKILSENGTLSVNDGSFVKSSPIKNGDRIVLKDTSSSIENSSTEVRLTIQVVDTSITFDTSWIVRTADYTPNPVSFFQSGAANPNTFITASATITGLTDGIDYTAEIISPDGLLSVNRGEYVKSQTIRNGQLITLGLQTSRKFRETVSVRVKIANSTFTWRNTTRDVEPNKDPYAEHLAIAVPYDRDFNDVTRRTRQISGVDFSAVNTYAGYTQGTGKNEPTISEEQSKFYFRSLKNVNGDGITRDTSTPAFVRDYGKLGRKDFTFECWIYPTSYSYATERTSPWIAANYGTQEAEGIGFTLTDNRFTQSGLISIQRFGTQTDAQFVSESNRRLELNSWNHVAITRKSDVFTIFINGANSGSTYSVIDIGRDYMAINDFPFAISPSKAIYMQDVRMYSEFVKYTSNFNVESIVSSIMERYDSEGIIVSSEGSTQLYTDPQGRILILSNTDNRDPRTLTKTLGQVLPGTNTCIDDERWQQFLSLAQTTDGYRLAVTQDQSTTKIINATSNNIRRMLNANRLSLRNSLTDWQNGLLAHDETSGSNLTGLDYSLLYWTTQGFGYYGQSSNPFFTNPEYAYYYQTANWWILPPGVPDF